MLYFRQCKIYFKKEEDSIGDTLHMATGLWVTKKHWCNLTKFIKSCTIFLLMPLSLLYWLDKTNIVGP